MEAPHPKIKSHGFTWYPVTPQLFNLFWNLMPLQSGTRFIMVGSRAKVPYVIAEGRSL